MPLGYQGWQKEFTTQQIDQTEEALLKVGDYFPQCNLMVLNAKTDGKYLGLKQGLKNISLDDIDSKYLLVEMYNELCFECINEVKNYTIFYHHFRRDPQLSKKIRIVGIGAGSSKRKVVKFRKDHQVPFPLFSDSKWYLFSCLGGPALPTSYLLKHESVGRKKIVFVQTGHIENIDRWMKRISEKIQD